MTNRKHHVKDKQITTLSGWFHSPLRVGERAIISGVNGFSILTSPILTILEVSNDSIVFETESTIYHLVHTRDRIGSDVCLNNIYELGSKLCELLSTLKKNREYVPLEILQTQYRVPYETLKKQIGDTATAFVKEITLSKLMINPDVSLEEQISVIQQAITTSGMLKEMSYTLSKLYDVELLHRQALKLRTYIEDALYPYIALQDCLVVDMERIEDTPIIYNTITQKVYENGQWSKQDLDLHGKLLIYVKSSPPMPAATEQINNGF